jgi:hypothetical protein
MFDDNVKFFEGIGTANDLKGEHFRTQIGSMVVGNFFLAFGPKGDALSGVRISYPEIASVSVIYKPIALVLLRTTDGCRAAFQVLANDPHQGMSFTPSLWSQVSERLANSREQQALAVH